jgi:pectate lyase
MRKLIALAACGVAAGGAIVALSAAQGGGLPVSVRQAEKLARETLGPNDGWAAFSTGTTGGAAAADENVYIVQNRSQLVTALAPIAGNPPRIIIVAGTIHANVDDNNQPLTCADYERNGYTLEAYLAAYDPAVWGTTKVPSGPLEDARKASATAQQGRIRVQIPSNTTVVGAGRDARIVGAHVRLNRVDNVIIRNITFEDAYDCFPQWDPTDGSAGNWNSQYDLISVLGGSSSVPVGSTHVWIDHCAFNDGAHPDSAQPSYFGRLYQQHDGAIDITNAADLVTVSWNRFSNHDKVMLIGSSDSGSTANGDVGKLNVTVHHNLFDRLVQRMPRVRFGKVHVYNNYYVVGDGFSYAWGVGIASQIFAENNFFEVEGAATPGEFIDWYKKPASALERTDIGIYVGETLVNGPAVKNHVNVLNEYNADNPTKQLAPTADWWPTLYEPMHPTAAVPALVTAKAGPFTLNEK